MKRKVLYVVFLLGCSSASAQYAKHEWIGGAAISTHFRSVKDKYDISSGFRTDDSQKQIKTGLSGGKLINGRWIVIGSINQDWVNSEFNQRQYDSGTLRYTSKSMGKQTILGLGAARVFYLRDSVFFIKLNGSLNFGKGKNTQEIRGSTFYDGNWDFQSSSYYGLLSPSIGFFLKNRFVFEVYIFSATFGYFDLKAVNGIGGNFVPLDTPTNRYYRSSLDFDGKSLAFAISYLFQTR
jgi:hypothetical protein